jgi:glycosyltransferase involved in cell wall biosynthesis
MSRPAALVISPEAPYPMHGGGALRTASLLHYLSRRYDLDVILFRQAGDSDPALSLPAGLVRRSFTVTLPFHSRRPPAWLLRNLHRWIRGAPPLLDRFSKQQGEISAILQGRSYDVGLIEHFWCAPYSEQISKVCKRTVLDLHNIESALHASCAKAGSWPISAAHRRFEDCYLRAERRWLPSFSRLLVTSEDDARRVRSLVPDAPVTVYRNALPMVCVPVGPEEQVIGFSGNFEYHPNIEGVKFFLKEIWPRLAAQFPDLTLRLIGKNPGAVAQYTRGAVRIETTGPVEDAVAELAKVQVAVVPLVTGSGTRLKILEAWAAARPVVATSLGAEGLGARPRVDIVLADTPQAFFASVAELLGSKDERRRIGCAARHTFETGYTWETAWKSLEGDVFG